MDSSNKIIYLLHEGLPATIIESQVFKHVQAMKDLQLDIEVWTFACTRSAFKEARWQDHFFHRKASRFAYSEAYAPLRIYRVLFTQYCVRKILLTA